MQKLTVLLLALILLFVIIVFIQTNFSLTSTITQSVLKNPVPIDNGLSRVEVFINFMILFSTVILGTFAAIGALLVWNGFALREEAKRDIEEIKEFGRLAARLYTKGQKEFKNFKKAADASQKNAGEMATVLNSLVEGAGRDSQTLKEKAQGLVSNYETNKVNYSNASQGTAQFFSTPIDSSKNPAGSLVNSAQNFLDILKERISREQK